MRYADEVKIDVVDVAEVDSTMIQKFSCGNNEIDRFLHEDACQNSAKTYLFVNTDTNDIVAYTTIACSAIMYAVEETGDFMLAPEKYSLASAIEIKYFAVDGQYQHLNYSDSEYTLSSALFGYIVEHIIDIATNEVGAEYIVLYSVPKAVSFYKKNSFVDFEAEMIGNGDPYLDGCHPMYMTVERS